MCQCAPPQQRNGALKAFAFWRTAVLLHSGWTVRVGSPELQCWMTRLTRDAPTTAVHTGYHLTSPAREFSYASTALPTQKAPMKTARTCTHLLPYCVFPHPYMRYVAHLGLLCRHGRNVPGERWVWHAVRAGWFTGAANWHLRLGWTCR